MKSTTNRPKPRPKKRNSNRSSRHDSWEDRESRDEKRDSRSTNDPQWYGTDPALLRDSASIPFSWPLGQASKGTLHLVKSNKDIDTIINVPGICALQTVPVFGVGTQSDALNVAAAQTYTYVRHTNAGHANYDPNDLMLYILGMTQVYSYINFLERLYGLAMYYDQKNRYVPDQIMWAMNVNPDSIRNNLADFRYSLNVLINKVSSIAVPATMSLFLRQAMLYAYIYSEGESTKDQMYFYYPDGFYWFDLDADGAGCLLYHRLNQEAAYTWDELIAYGTQMFDAIWEQEDFGIMSGDILKSYGTNILMLKSVDEVLPFAPVFDPMVLHQMKNASVIHHTHLDLANLDVHQNSAKSKLINDLNFVSNLSNNAFDAYQVLTQADKILTIDAVAPTPEMVIEATRLMVGGEVNSIGGDDYIKIITGTEVVCAVNYRMGSTGTGFSNKLIGGYVAYTVPDMTANQAQNLATNKAFKFAPKLTYFGFNVNGELQTYWDSKEVDNFAVLSVSDIDKMHGAALLNMLNVPSPAKNVGV